ncbi:MAG: hypothetical protein RR662_05280 [Clostridia bacterium]
MINEKEYLKNYKKNTYKQIFLEIPKEQDELFSLVLKNKKEKRQTVIKKLIKEYVKGEIKMEEVFKMLEGKTQASAIKILEEAGFKQNGENESKDTDGYILLDTYYTKYNKEEALEEKIAITVWTRTTAEKFEETYELDIKRISFENMNENEIIEGKI